MEAAILKKEILKRGYYGLPQWAWKKEFIGKKKIDLACDIVEQVCNIQDIISTYGDFFYI